MAVARCGPGRRVVERCLRGERGRAGARAAGRAWLRGDLEEEIAVEAAGGAVGAEARQLAGAGGGAHGGREGVDLGLGEVVAVAPGAESVLPAQQAVSLVERGLIKA